MKVCWLTRQASPYKMKLLNLLGEKIYLHVFLYDERTEVRGSSWYSYYSENIKLEIIDKNYIERIWKSSEECDVFIDSMYSTKYGIIANIFFRLHNKTTILQADGGIATSRGKIVDYAIGVLMKMHNYYLSSCAVTDKYFLFYGVKKDRIKHYRFSSLTEEDIRDNYKSRISNQKHTPLRILSVGQPIHRKGFDILIKVIEKINKGKVTLTIVGGKPQKELLEYITKKHIDNVVFVDNVKKQELNKYYLNSDLFVLCTREDIWGLVINEALSFGLPVLTTNMCVAGLHFNSISESVFVNDVYDIDSYVKVIEKILNLNQDDYSRLCIMSRESVSSYTIENSAYDIYSCLKEIIELS